MKEEDIKRLKEAFAEAISNLKDPDAIAPGGMTNKDGSPKSIRERMHEVANDPEFYEAVEMAVKAGHATIDEFVTLIKKPMP